MDTSFPVSTWVDTDLALDELHWGQDLCLVDTDVNMLDHYQQQQSTSTMLGFDTLSAFLSEIEQLEDDADAEHPQKEAPLVADSKPAAAIDASFATESTKKKKLNSAQRARRDKKVLEETIAKLEEDVARISKAHQDKFAHIHKRWKFVIRQERHKLKRVMAAQRRLHQLVDTQSKKASQLHDLMRQWTDLMLFCPPVQIGQPLQSPDSRDAAIFALLDRNVELKYHLLQQQMQVMDAADVARDSQKTNFSPDNKTMDVYCSWVVPFDVAKITEISWQWAQIEYIDCHVEQTPRSLSTHTLKQELVLSALNYEAMKLTLRVVCKRFVSDAFTVLHWEGICDWSTLNDNTRRTSTQESGWVIFRPLQISPPISVVQSFAQVTPSDSREPWMQYMQKRSVLGKVILPSSQQAMIVRHQSVENRLVGVTS